MQWIYDWEYDLNRYRRLNFSSKLEFRPDNGVAFIGVNNLTTNLTVNNTMEFTILVNYTVA